MTTVAVMTQPMRGVYCGAYLRKHAPEGDAVVIVSDAASVATAALPAGTAVRMVRPAEQVLPTGRFLASKARQRTLVWARSGSELGARFERLARAIVWRLRYLDRMVLLDRRRRERRASAGPPTALTRELEQVHAASPIDEIVVFDLFDLAPALLFAEAYDVPLLVR